MCFEKWLARLQGVTFLPFRQTPWPRVPGPRSSDVFSLVTASAPGIRRFVTSLDQWLTIIVSPRVRPRRIYSAHRPQTHMHRPRIRRDASTAYPRHWWCRSGSGHRNWLLHSSTECRIVQLGDVCVSFWVCSRVKSSNSSSRVPNPPGKIMTALAR